MFDPAVLEILGVSDCSIADGHIRETQATVAYRPDADEVARRRACSLGPVPQLHLLDLLMNLPVGVPIPPETLTKSDRRYLRRLPAGCVDITPEGFVRQIAQPLRVELAIVTSRTLKAGLKRAGMFGPYCRRALVLDGTPKHLELAASEADFWGIGLVINARTHPHMVVPPAEFEQYRHTPAGWSFLEWVYGFSLAPERVA